MLALGTAALVLFVRLFLLHSLQNEFYGDIEIDYNRVARIRDGEWPFDFVLSVGPLYAYLTTPIVAVAGMSYFGFKLTSVIVSPGVLLFTYAVGRRLIDDRFALLACAIAGVSSWLLIWSRLGNAPIVVPLLTMSALWLTLRVAQAGRTADVIACAAVSALGLFSFPQGIVLPGVTLATLLCLRWFGHRIGWRQLRLFVLVTAACAVPFAVLLARNASTFTTGYVGSKFVTDANPFMALLNNLAHAALAFHIRGDSNFRSNPRLLPHLDVISGVLFLAGVVFWLLPERRRWSPALLVPFVLLQLPSVLVLGRPGEVPSATRTLGVAPIAYLLVASGMWWLAGLFRRAGRARLGVVLSAILFVALFGLNMDRYFNQYIGGLPYHNTSISAEIAAYADRLPPETRVYLAGCCWESSMPETPYVRLVVARPDKVQELNPRDLTCDALQFLARPAVLVWSFHDQNPAPQLAKCQQWLPAQLFLSPRGWPVFYAAPLMPGLPLSQPDSQRPPPGDAPNEELVYGMVTLNGEPVGVRYSPIDMGQVVDIFDGKTDTLMRGRDANPLVIEVRFDQPHTFGAIGLDLATMPQFQVRVVLTAPDGQVQTLVREYNNLPADPHIDLPLAEDSHKLSVVRIEILDQRAKPPEGYHVHIRELQLR